MSDRKHDLPPEAPVRDLPASGGAGSPIGPDDAQPGDRTERGAEFGGPVDIFPNRRAGPGVEQPIATDEDRDPGEPGLERPEAL